MITTLRLWFIQVTWKNTASFCVTSWFTDCSCVAWALAETLFLVGFLAWCQLDVWRSQVLWRSEVTRSPASFDWSGRGSPAAERARCGQSPRCGSPLLDAGTPLLDGRSPQPPSHPPPALPAAYVCKDEWDQDFSNRAKPFILLLNTFHIKMHKTVKYLSKIYN